MTSSTEKGGAEAVAAIKARAGETAEAVWFGADLCDLKATRAAIDKLVADEDRLDLVVLDAGFMRSHDTTADGIEHTFVVNWLSNVLFVNRLLPLLRKTAGRANGGARIVVVSSEHHRFCPSAMHFGSLEEINDPSLTPSQIYGRTKVRSALGSRARAAQVLTAIRRALLSASGRSDHRVRATRAAPVEVGVADANDLLLRCPL
jgi:NAD(P)-dependent dehydrogenase (short-subunit alcohol dehydrogenase family)